QIEAIDFRDEWWRFRGPILVLVVNGYRYHFVAGHYPHLQKRLYCGLRITLRVDGNKIISSLTLRGNQSS
ncbi:MAG: hypothetical protein ACFFBD_06895, partial [Candidatus Hodarchaeota archaeon]